MALTPAPRLLLLLALRVASALRLAGKPVAFIEARKPPMQIPKPIVWLHIRKSGTSFVNTLLHHKDLCPDWPDNATLDSSRVMRFWRSHELRELCPEGFSKTYESPPGCAGIGPSFDLNEGRVMGFFRQPEQRFLSDFFYHNELDGRTLRHRNLKDLEWVRQQFQGCVVKSLTRENNFTEPAWASSNLSFPREPCVTGESPTQEEVELAVQRVRRLAFVGLTEEWNMSICLFHAMYGGPCRQLELMNTRPGPRNPTNNTGSYNTSMLEGWTDPYDGPVYKVATEVFWERVEEWGVTREGCERSCDTEALAA